MKNQKRLQVNNKKSTIFEIKSDSKISIDYRNHKNTIIKAVIVDICDKNNELRRKLLE